MASELLARDGKKLKIRLHPDDPNMLCLVTELNGLKWGIKNAMMLGLDSFATQMIKKHKAIQKDKELMLELKQIGTRENCIEFFRYIYKGYGRKKQTQLY